MPTKEEVADLLAQEQYEVGEDVRAIYRLQSEAEDDPNEPVKLLLVREETLPVGIMPLSFGAFRERGWQYPFSLVVVTPEEFEQVREGGLPLPTGWSVGHEIPERVPAVRAVA